MTDLRTKDCRPSERGCPEARPRTLDIRPFWLPSLTPKTLTLFKYAKNEKRRKGTQSDHEKTMRNGEILAKEQLRPTFALPFALPSLGKRIKSEAKKELKGRLGEACPRHEKRPSDIYDLLTYNTYTTSIYQREYEQYI